MAAISRNDHFADITLTGNLSPGDDSRVTNSLIPSTNNSEDLGSTANRWKTTYSDNGLFTSLDIGTASSPRLSKSVAACCTGMVEVNTGLYALSTLATKGAIDLQNNATGVIFRNGIIDTSLGKQGVVQAGDVASGTAIWLADNTYNLPDLAQGGGTATSGFLYGASAAKMNASVGNCTYVSGVNTSSNAGILENSGIGCNTHVSFPVNTRQVIWTNGSFSIALTSAAATANRVHTLPDLPSANMVLDTATQTLTNKTFSDTILTKRVRASQGTALIAGDFVLSSGWGSTAAISSIIGTDQAFTGLITSSGTGQAPNPTLTLTFKDGTWTNSPVCQAWDSGGSGALADWTVTSRSATAYTFQWDATPVVSLTYEITAHCWGR